MSVILFLACGAVAAATILAVVLVAVLDWAAAPFLERLALCGIGAGLVWGAPSRLAAGGLGFGDLVLLVGILGLVLLTYGRRLARHADLVDGRLDGQVRFPFLAWANPERIEAELRDGQSRRP